MEFRKIPMLHNLYEISADGKHFRRVSTCKGLKIHEGVSQGYSLVVFTINKRYPEEDVLRASRRAHVNGVHRDGSPVHQMTLKVHQLVYDAWVGPVPDGMVIDHIDHVRTNNSVDNLRAVTLLENARNRLDANSEKEARRRNDRGNCQITTPQGRHLIADSKDAAFRLIAEFTGRRYRTVFNTFYRGAAEYKGYTLKMSDPKN